MKTYLKFQAIDFRCMPSSNHASPTGALPFLLPASSSSEARVPIPSGRIQRWIRDGKTVKAPKTEEHASSNSAKAPQSDEEEPPGKTKSREDVDIRYDAYMSLIDHRIRNAYVSPPFHPETFRLTDLGLVALLALSIPFEL